MVLDDLGSSLKGTLRKIANAVYVDSKLIKEVVRDIQRALLQADVNVKLVLDAGANVIVAGSYFFGAKDPKEAIRKLRLN